MKEHSRLTMRWTVALLLAAVLLSAGAVAAYLLLRPSTAAMHDMAAMTRESKTAPGPASPPAPHSGAAATAGAEPLRDVTVTIAEDMVERAGITVAAVRAGEASTTIRVPGVVEANAYRQVDVTPVVAGRVTRVVVELGDAVRRGQTLAQVYSPELAEAQMRYLSARADLQASEQQLRRTQELLKIGAASRQELERVTAEHTTRATAVEGTRSQLLLVGMSPSAIDRLSSASEINATASVPAPIDGVVTERDANLGLNVDTSTKLFTVVDLSTVWVVADLYEKDFDRVPVGSPVTVTTTAYPDRVAQGQVSYIDPQVNPDTRTARLRVEVSNPRRELRLGMFAEVQVRDDAAGSVAVVPRGAVQNVGDRHVVYLVNPKKAGVFVEREVRLGESAGEDVEVLAGVTPGDVVVSEGSFFVRAERERLGLRQQTASAASATSTTATPATSQRARPAAVQMARITVDDQKFEPSRLTLQRGVPVRLTFVRTSEKTCATAVAFPTLDIRRDLPLNQPVAIEFTPQQTGEIAFACGMNMLRGTILVQ